MIGRWLRLGALLFGFAGGGVLGFYAGKPIHEAAGTLKATVQWERQAKAMLERQRDRLARQGDERVKDALRRQRRSFNLQQEAQEHEACRNLSPCLRHYLELRDRAEQAGRL